tara:strand:- start:22401 stop:22841 length:441 start_codon:yes stop_codon:yes gene_type:complete
MADRKSRMMYDIQWFHEKMGLSYDGRPRMLSPKFMKARIDHMQEELNEFHFAFLGRPKNMDLDMYMSESHCSTPDKETMHELLDALVDLTYVTLGTAYLMGFDFDEAWNRVHAANMQKVPKSTERSEHDVVKPEGWQPADLEDLCQ